MKNFFACEKESKKYDGEPFLVRRLEGADKTAYDNLQSEREKFARHEQPPAWARYLFIGCLLVGLLLLAIALELVPEEGAPSDAVRTAIMITAITGGVLTVVGFGYCIYFAIRIRRLKNSSDYRFFLEREKKCLAECGRSLGVPDTAVQADVFGYVYRMKNGKRKPVAPASKNCCLNLSVRLWQDGDALYAASEDAVYQIPFSGSMHLVRIESRKYFYGWNKDDGSDKAKRSAFLKQYKIRMNDRGAFSVKPCYSLQFYANGEDYELFFPAYEYETVSRLTGRTA
ncbi:MAG: hypothetical protein K2H43_03525 [Clostridia bacterium]|nr:hypothetical protein [Clostridia bacterium]